MKKIIYVNKKLKENLVESSIKVGEKDYANRLRRRVTDLRRVSQMAKEAAEKAEAKGDIELAKKLRAKAEEMEDLIAKVNMDSLDDDTEVDNTTPDSEEGDTNEDDLKSSEEDDNTTGEEEEAEEDKAEEEPTEDDSEQNNDTETTLKRNLQDEGDPDDISNMEPTEVNSVPDSTEENQEAKIKDTSSETNDKDDTEDTESDIDDSGKEDEKDTNDAGDDEESSEEVYGTPDEDEDSNIDNDVDDIEDSTTDEENSIDVDLDGDSEEETDSDEIKSDESEEQKNGKNGSSTEEESQESTDEEDESNETETEDDPFADEEDIPNIEDLLGGNGQQDPREATLKDIIKQLKTLTGESKQGAIAGLQDILNSRKTTTESLTEAVKGVREMTDDEFGNYINRAYDLIDEADALDYIDEKELKDKKTKVGQWTTDPKALKELEAEGNFVVAKDAQKVVSRDKEKQKYTKVGTLDQFKLNFYRAISNQVEIIRQEILSYLEINPEYESEDVIVKAEIMKEMPEVTIPTVDVYFDVSSSWGSEEIEIGKKAIASVKSYEDAGELKINLFYFGNEVRSTPDGCGGGTRAWRKILQNIAATKARNVLIITDGDMNEWGEYGAKGGPTLKVDGCVWFLWKNGETAPECVKHLIGKEGNYQYAFYMSDFE